MVEPVDGARHALAWTLRLAEIWWERTAGTVAVEQRARMRLDALVGFARERSPLYREAYRHVPHPGVELATLPVMHKRALMTRFDDWVTDRRVRLDGVARFIADRDRIGQPYLGQYLTWKSSGTSGEPGIYLQDAEAVAIYDALLAVQLARSDLAGPCLSGVVRHGGRAALVAATGDHFASIASWQRVCRAAPGLAAHGFSILEPLERLVGDLNAFAPAYLASYPTMLGVLGQEQDAGRLRVQPDLIWSGGEYLSAAGKARIERAFGCAVVDEYGASECLSIAFGCSEGWLHANADWVLVEPVEQDYSPTPPGRLSHSVLVTNLANRVQPIIRYDLGDAVVTRPEPCPCGNPMPAIRVHGRCDDVLHVKSASGRTLRLPPLALATVVEEAAGIGRFQIVQRSAECLALRIERSEERAAVDRAIRALRGYLDAQGAAAVRVVVDSRAPRRDAKSGKLRQVVAKGRLVDRGLRVCNPGRG